MKSSFDAHYADDESRDSSDDGPAEPSASSPYQYKPLEQGEIRLLVLLEADGLEDDLECGLIALPLAHFAPEGDNSDSFTALSYVWGHGSRKRAVYVDDQVIHVSRNLDTALRYLRRRDRHILLWVDAICINQSDVSERNHQVQQMRDIFECAHETVAYLGDHDDGNIAHSAWNFLERHSTWALNENLDQSTDVPKRRQDQIHFRGDLYAVYHAVLTREWFQRVWVFQEAVVSKRLSIQSRHRRVPWDDFVRCTVLQGRKHDRYGQSLAQASGFDFVRQLWQARVSFHAARKQEQYLPSWYPEHMDPVHDVLSTDMLDILVLARRRQASDSRDKVFALLGVSTGFDWQANGTVDYGKAPAEVFKDFAYDYMVTNKDYRVLSYLDRASRPEYFHRQVKHWKLARQNLPGNAVAIAGYRMEESEVNALEAEDEYSTLFREELTEQIPLQSEWLDKDDKAGGPVRHHLRSTAQACSRRLQGLRDDLRGYDDSERLQLPTWVPNWDCKNLTDHEPRAIIEVADPVRSSRSMKVDASDEEPAPPQIDVEAYRTWVSGHAPGWGSVPRGNLAVQGRVLGKVVSGMSSTSLLGRDESMFSELQSRWKKEQEYQTFPLEAHVLSLWTKLLKQTWLAEEPVMQDMGRLRPEQSRRAVLDIGNELSGNPHRRTLDEFDLDTLPPRPGSIEAYLVERAQMLTDWSADSIASLSTVTAPKSIIDRRLLGLYRGTKISPRNRHPRDVLLQERYKARCGTDLGPEKLVLLPSEAKFGDLVVLFPGAKVPFLVRKKRVCGMEHWSTRKLHGGNLPNMETAKSYVECALVGECWVNGFADIAREEKVFDIVFSVQ
ncbi:hypothetical protein NLU13_8642 [Sarocladium strictum]|uniref:Heterokaryon incompatibility domain-containing protein n=1 Tax=Sarocladium strictum TaxID=5046 RepID=A0AA39L4U5_SARSR|nr:hypothetical protein NLU13_8642 [Sarocladium strictum]